MYYAASTPFSSDSTNLKKIGNSSVTNGYTYHTLHLGYNDLGFPQAQIAVDKASLITGGNRDGLGMIKSLNPNSTISGIVISRVH